MKHTSLAIFSLFVIGLPAAATTQTAQDSASLRQEQVARHGASVMPFDLARTTHFFDDTTSGGIETVRAQSVDDHDQAKLIRSHLALEARRFARGDFSDPAKIHGADMPGLRTLAAALGKLHVTYKEVPGGASLTYASRDSDVVAAIHEWFAAQRSDHGAHEHMHH